jgi:hypothetical protein
MTKDRSLDDEIHASGNERMAGRLLLTAVIDDEINVYNYRPDGIIRDVYSVPLAALQGGLRTAFWVRQLADMSWMTKEHLAAFASDVIAHFGLK